MPRRLDTLTAERLRVARVTAGGAAEVLAAAEQAAEQIFRSLPFAHGRVAHLDARRLAMIDEVVRDFSSSIGSVLTRRRADAIEAGIRSVAGSLPAGLNINFGPTEGLLRAMARQAEFLERPFRDGIGADAATRFRAAIFRAQIKGASRDERAEAIKARREARALALGEEIEAVAPPGTDVRALVEEELEREAKTIAARAMATLQTEIGRGYAMARHASGSRVAAAIPGTTHAWTANLDHLVRPEHEAEHRRTQPAPIPFSEPFRLKILDDKLRPTGRIVLMRHPQDPEARGNPRDVLAMTMRCRCDEAVILPDAL